MTFGTTVGRSGLLDEAALDGLDRYPHALRAAVGGLDADALQVGPEFALGDAGHVRADPAALLRLTLAIDDRALDGTATGDCTDSGHDGFELVKGSEVIGAGRTKQGDFSRLWRPSGPSPHCVQDLELLPEVSCVQELHQRQLARTRSGGLGRADCGDDIARVVNEKRFLEIECRRREAVPFQRRRKPVPANVTGQVLFAWSGQQVVGLRVPVIGSRRSRGRLGGELLERLPIIDRDEQPPPLLDRDLIGERGRGERLVEMIALGGADGRFPDDIRIEFDFQERVGAQRHAQFPPAAATDNMSEARLGVEQLVGKNDTLAAERDGDAPPDGLHVAKGVGHAAEHACRAGLRADLHPGVRRRIAAGGHQPFDAGGADEFAEERTGRGCGEEIRARLTPDADLVPAIVADLRVIERELHEAIETHRAVRLRARAEGGPEFGRDWRRWGG